MIKLSVLLLAVLVFTVMPFAAHSGEGDDLAGMHKAKNGVDAGDTQSVVGKDELPGFCGLLGNVCGWCGRACEQWMAAMIGDGGLDV